MRPSASSRLRTLAREDPDRLAVVARDETWTYAALDRTVEAFASWLLARHDAGEIGEIVALRYRSTVALIISSLALSRSGLVCALIDPLAPPARVRLVLDDLDAGPLPVLLVTDSADDVAEHAGSRLFAEIVAEGKATDVPVDGERSVDELQNIVYTSGSTGVPIGLQVDGRQREAIGDWARTFDAFRDGVRVGVIAAGSLGQSAEFPRIVVATGGTIMVHDVLTQGLNDIPRWLREQRVEAIGLVPTLIRFLMPLLDEQLGADPVLADLATVAVWGESSDWDDIAKLGIHLPAHAVVHNAYATTETGMIAALSLPVSELPAPGARSGPLPAGTPLPEVTVRILDADGDLAPPGASGEIVVSSPHLAQGHWRRPELTAEALIEDGAGRSWRTGDGGRLDGDVLHVAGRLDGVAKISGHRVSLAELEQVAREQAGVSDAAATARPDSNGAMRLHLYVVASPGAVVEPAWVRAGLARSLPPSALPDTVDLLDSLPVLSNGKVDRASLPPPSDTPSAPPADSALTDQVVALFAEVLDRTGATADDDFFELGGDSVRAGRLVAALQSRFGYYVAASLLLEAATPRALAAALAGSHDGLLVPVRTSGDMVPLFVVHGGAGDVLFARALAVHLDPSQPVYALQPPPLHGPVPFASTLREIAERYLAHVRRVRPTGPYRIYGYSLGGVIAFEMALQLQADGEAVELLALGDTETPESLRASYGQRERSRAARSPWVKVSDHLGYRSRQLRRMLSREDNPDDQWRQFLGGGDPAPEIRGDAYLRVYGQLAYSHEITGKFVGEMVLVLSADAAGSSDRGWAAHVQGTVRTVSVDAVHDDLAVEPAISAVGQALRDP